MNPSIVHLINAINQMAQTEQMEQMEQMEQVRKLKNFKYQRAEEAAMVFLTYAASRKNVPISVEVEHSFKSYSDVTIKFVSSTNDYWTKIFIATFQIIEYIKSHNRIDRSHILWFKHFLDNERVEPPLYGQENEYKECEEIVTCIIADMVLRVYLIKSEAVDALAEIGVSPESTLLFIKETEHLSDDLKDILKL